MKVLEMLSEKLIKTAQAITVDQNIGVTTCYLGTADLKSTVTDIIQWALYPIPPLLAFITSVISAQRFLKRKTFSLHYAVYKSFKRVLMLALIGCVLVFGFMYLIYSTSGITADTEFYRSSNSFDYGVFFITIGIISAVTFIAAGAGYVIFSLKDKRILALAFSYIFIIPAIIIFLKVIIYNLMPEYKKLLPADAVFGKKKDLQEKLVQQGKLPTDPSQKP